MQRSEIRGSLAGGWADPGLRFAPSGLRCLTRLCEEPTGRANARPMTGSATKQSILRNAAPWIASRSLSSGGLRADPLARNDDKKRIVPNAASARHLLCARQHRADRRLARSGENSGSAVVDAAQERISRKTLSDQSELQRYRRAEMLSLDR